MIVNIDIPEDHVAEVAILNKDSYFKLFNLCSTLGKTTLDGINEIVNIVIGEVKLKDSWLYPYLKTE